ncbi:hypothetical protein BDR04DRAFT_724822 [Suillus decipiens]|nr:hypothetical protein BDR04DRAFT_724822 [Suillus decipiens]
MFNVPERSVLVLSLLEACDASHSSVTTAGTSAAPLAVPYDHSESSNVWDCKTHPVVCCAYSKKFLFTSVHTKAVSDAAQATRAVFYSKNEYIVHTTTGPGVQKTIHRFSCTAPTPTPPPLACV